MNLTTDQKFLTLGTHKVPSIWQRYLPEDFFHLQFPHEREATCQRCPEVVKHGFLMPYRCCSYIPAIANFRLGAALIDRDCQTNVRKALTMFALPEGSVISPALNRISIEENLNERYGRTQVIQCPFFDQEQIQCGVYPYRNAVCATYFCWHDQGIRGQMFWESIQNLVGQIESSLAQWCMSQLGCDLKRYFSILNRLSDNLDKASDGHSKGWHPDVMAELFDFWPGSRQTFFIACHQLINKAPRNLFDLAASFETDDAFGLNRAIYDQLPSALQKEAGSAPIEPVASASLATLWYEVQLSHRHLWRLPFGEDPVILNDRVVMAPNPRETSVDQFYQDRDYKLAFMEKDDATKIQFELYLSYNEVQALAQFKTAKRVDSELLASPWLNEWGDPRIKLSEWLRLLILIPDRGEDLPLRSKRSLH